MSFSPTLICLAANFYNEPFGCRAVLGSTTHHLITEGCVKMLQLEDEISDCNNVGSKVRVEVQSTSRAFSTTIECSVIPTIDIRSPSEDVSFDVISSKTGVIPLADPDLHLARPIDLFLSTDLMRSFIGECYLLSDELIHQDSTFGALISGKLFV